MIQDRQPGSNTFEFATRWFRCKATGVAAVIAATILGLLVLGVIAVHAGWLGQ